MKTVVWAFMYSNGTEQDRSSRRGTLDPKERPASNSILRIAAYTYTITICLGKHLGFALYDSSEQGTETAFPKKEFNIT